MWTVNLGRGEMLRTVQSEQVTVLKKDQWLQNLTALNLTENGTESRSDLFGLDVIEECAQVRVRRNVLDVIDRTHVLVVAALVKREQGRIFEREHRETREESVCKGNGAG